MKRPLNFLWPVFLPVALIVLLELALRIGHYGYSTSYVIQRSTPTGPKAVLNPAALLSYLSFNSAYSSNESFLNLPIDKPAGNMRVAVLGGSAAHGPYQVAGVNLARYLQTMLELRFPDRQIEVVNLAAPGLNTSAMVGVLKDALQLKPDVVVCYEAANDLGRLPLMQKGVLPPRTVIWAEETLQALKRLKIYQLAVDCAGRYLRKIPEFMLKADGIGSRPMPSLTPDAAGACGDAFRHNMKKITAICRENHIPVILCTYAYNMKNLCTADPFQKDTTLPAIEAYMPLLRRAYACESAGDYRAAIGCYQEFHNRFPQFADPPGHMAFCYQALSRPGEAARWYDKARSLSGGFPAVLDNLNQVLRDIACESSQDDIFLADVVEALITSSPFGFMPGEESFTDLVHFTSEGCYQAAAEIYRALAVLIAGGGAVASPPSQAECHRRMGVTLPQLQALMAAQKRETFSGLTALLGQAPMTYALMNDVTKEYRLKIFAEGLNASGRQDEETFSGEPLLSADHAFYFYKNRIAGLSSTGAQAAAKAVAERLVEATDRHSLALMAYGEILLSNHQPEAALSIFQEALGQPARVFDLGLRLRSAEVLLSLDRTREAVGILEPGERIIQNREPVAVLEKRLFGLFKQQYLSVMESARRRLCAPVE